jgi:hypothetical protein
VERFSQRRQKNRHGRPATLNLNNGLDSLIIVGGHSVKLNVYSGIEAAITVAGAWRCLREWGCFKVLNPLDLSIFLFAAGARFALTVRKPQKKSNRNAVGREHGIHKKRFCI